MFETLCVYTSCKAFLQECFVEFKSKTAEICVLHNKKYNMNEVSYKIMCDVLKI